MQGLCGQPTTPHQRIARPNGLTVSEEFCQLARYAGYSDRLSSVGFFEARPLARRRWPRRPADLRGHLVLSRRRHAQNGRPPPRLHRRLLAIQRWCLTGEDHEVIFYKSPRSDRWWMDIPTPGAGNRKGRILSGPLHIRGLSIRSRRATAGPLVANTAEAVIIQTFVVPPIPDGNVREPWFCIHTIHWNSTTRHG